MSYEPDYCLEGVNGEIGYYMRWYPDGEMTRKEAYFLLRMHDVYAKRTPWKLENGTTKGRLQAELGRFILGSSAPDWRWTERYLENPPKSKAGASHPKSSLTDNGPICAPPARTRKGRTVPKKAQRRGVAKVLQTKGVLVAEAVRDTFQSVTVTGFGVGKAQGRYDMLYLCRNPYKNATDKLLAHISKESLACQMKRQRRLLTTSTS